MKFLKSLFKSNVVTLTVTVSNRNVARVRALIAEGFTAAFNAITRLWVMTKKV